MCACCKDEDMDEYQDRITAFLAERPTHPFTASGARTTLTAFRRLVTKSTDISDEKHYELQNAMTEY